MELKFYRYYSQNIQISNCSMRTGGRTDMTKLIVAFRKFAKAPKNCARILHGVIRCLKNKKELLRNI